MLLRTSLRGLCTAPFYKVTLGGGEPKGKDLNRHNRFWNVGIEIGSNMK
jgi:hypothetical protein